MQVSVPGMYQNPAPYREQILTYSTALALTGRSAACAPLMATRPAAEPRIRLLTIFMLTSKLLYWERLGPTVVQSHFRKNHFAPIHTRSAQQIASSSIKLEPTS